MGRTSETHHNKEQSTTMAKKTLSSRKLLETKKGKYARGKGLSGIHKQLSGIHKQIANNKVQVAGKDGNQDHATKSINTIDFMSFWICLALYLMFNIAYWNYY